MYTKYFNLVFMYDQKWDVFQLGVVLWSLFCDKSHPYNESLKTIIDPRGRHNTSLISTLWTIQTTNLGIPSATEWQKLQDFRIPNVQINMQDEVKRTNLMYQLKDVITEIPEYRQHFSNAEYDSKTKRCELIINIIEQNMIYTVFDEMDDKRLAFLNKKFPELIQTDSSYSNYVSILADMLHFVPDDRFSAAQALGEFRNLFTHAFKGYISISEFSGRFPELSFLESLNLTTFSTDVDFNDFEKTVRRFSGVSSTIEVMPAPDRVDVPDVFFKPPNSDVMHVGMKALKLFVEKKLEKNPDFLEVSLNNINEMNQRTAKTGFVEQLQALLPFTWSEEKVQNWLYDEAKKHHALNPKSHPVFHCRNCNTNVNLLGMGLNGSFIFSPQISSVETGPEPSSLRPDLCGRNHGLDKITETQKTFILRMVKARLQEFFNLHGFEMGMLSGWQNGEWFSINQVDFVVAGSSDDEAQLEGSYQKILTKFLKIEEKVAFSFKMSVSTEADADVIYFVFSYPNTEKKYSPERPLLREVA